MKTIGRAVGVLSTVLEGAELGPAVGVPVGFAVGSPAYKVTMTFPSPPSTCPNFLLRDPTPTPFK